jgi:hypothetical protein
MGLHQENLNENQAKGKDIMNVDVSDDVLVGRIRLCEDMTSR